MAQAFYVKRLKRKDLITMPYITIKQPPVFYQISFEEMIAGVQDLSKYVMPNITNTRTYHVERPNDKLLENTDISGMINLLAAFSQSKERQQPFAPVGQARHSSIERAYQLLPYG